MVSIFQKRVKIESGVATHLFKLIASASALMASGKNPNGRVPCGAMHLARADFLIEGCPGAPPPTMYCGSVRRWGFGSPQRDESYPGKLVSFFLVGDEGNHISADKLVLEMLRRSHHHVDGGLKEVGGRFLGGNEVLCGGGRHHGGEASVSPCCLSSRVPLEPSLSHFVLPGKNPSWPSWRWIQGRGNS